MKNAYHYLEYIERRGADLCKQILSRAYVFLAIDILIFIAHATFLSFDMGLGGASSDPSFLHIMSHILSLALLIACMFLQIYLYDAITSCTDISSLRLVFMGMSDAINAGNEEMVSSLTKEKIATDMVNIEDATKKASKLLGFIEFFTCGACCLLFLIPI